MRIPVQTLLTFLIILVISPNYSIANPPAKGETLPDISLPVPEDPEQQQYLGVTDKDVFKIPQIESEIVIIEIFSMY